jgi:Glu-tRNA(Gln) amidotransferase subunit E-like FAD-binding protein
LLIELPRRKRREGIRLTDQNIDALAEGLSSKIIMPEQVDSVIDILAKQPSLSIEETIEQLGISRVSEAELRKLALQKLRLFDEDKIRSDLNYRKFVKPKIVGEVLKAVNHSVSGRKVAEKIDSLIERR